MIRASKISWHLTSLGVCLLLPGILASVTYSQVLFQRYRAEELIDLLSGVRPGRTSMVVMRTQLERKSFHPGGSRACLSDASRGCDQFEFTNRWLSSLHVSPSKYVWVTLNYRDGVVISKSVQFAEDPRLSAITRQLLREDEPSFGDSMDSDHRVIVNINSAENAIVKVYDNEDVSTDQRQSDWRIDLSCLSRIRACIDPRTILPGAFPKH